MNNLAWQIPLCVLAFLFVARLIAAPYLIWQKDQRTISDLENRLTNRNPYISASIEQLTSPQLISAEMSYFLNVTIRNTGAPSSVADDWQVSIFSNGITHMGNIRHVQNVRIGYGDNTKAMVLNASDMIYDKAIYPIPSGGFIRGWISAVFTDLSQSDLDNPALEITLSFQDIHGNKHSAKRTPKQESVLNSPVYHPDGTGGFRIEDMSKINP